MTEPISMRARATHEARARLRTYADERLERLLGYEIEWCHAWALAEETARARPRCLSGYWKTAA